METTCASSINMVGTIMKGQYQTPKTGCKILLVCYHLAISKMTMTGSVCHVLDLPISFLNAFKKESSIAKERATIPVDRNMFQFSKITLEQRLVKMSFF